MMVYAKEPSSGNSTRPRSAARVSVGQPPVRINRRSATPAYRQIYARFREAIARGILRPGERLPSARSLASQLATARGTVDLAYSLLSEEGFIVSRGAAGTCVALGIIAPAKPSNPSLHTPLPTPLKRSEMPSRRIRGMAPFQMGVPALDAFPYPLWTRLTNRRARQVALRGLVSPDPVGYEPLRAALASYLAVARGIMCSPAQIVITCGFQGALGIITRAFLRAADQVWMENPGYFLARAALAAAGATLVPVAVDAEGIDVAAGMAQAPQARFAYVTPSHQSPLGMSLSLPRRLALLAWADRARAWIIEDDYDGEFRYESRPLPALKSLDESGRVLYTGTFSKVLLPGFRLGYLVVPEGQIDLVRRTNELFYRGCPTLEQAIITDFIVDGHFARHIKRMRTLYSERRAALFHALEKELSDQVHVELQAGGMHLVARFPGLGTDLALVESASRHGLAPMALSPWFMKRPSKRGPPALLLSFTNIPCDTADLAVTRLAQALRLPATPRNRKSPRAVPRRSIPAGADDSSG